MFYRLPPQLESEIAELEKRIEDVNAGRMNSAELKVHRVPFGVYEQRKINTYMMRLRCPGGAATPAQLRLAAQLAQKFGASILHITTRQELQLHDILVQDIVPIMRTLKDAGLSTRGGGGNTVRNIVASPSAGADPGEPFDVSPHVFALTSRFLAEPDSWRLPRKFKIAFSNTEADSARAAFQDVGFIATIKESRPGFIVYLAGGLGAKPAAGKRVHEFLPAEDVYIVAEAVKLLYDRCGNRRNRHRNRLRFLWEDMGEPAFLEKYRSFEAEVRAGNPAPLRWDNFLQKPSAPLPEPLRAGGESFERWKRRYVFPHRRPDLRQVLFPVPHGNLPAAQALLLADFLEPFGPDVLRGTREQNFLLRHIPESHLGNVYELLKNWNSLVSSAPFVGRTAVCTGASTCKQGICLPRPAMDAITEQLAQVNLPLDDLEDFQMNLSGCPNSCGNHWTADIGFYGKAAHKKGRLYPAYRVVAGGRAGEGTVTLAKNVGEVAAKHLPAFVHEFLEFYLSKKSRFGAFREYLKKDGGEDLRVLCRRYSEAPEFDANPDFYHDWGATQPFSMADRGQGECSAGLFDLIEFDLKKAREILDSPDIGNPAEDRAALLYQAVLHSARALLITRGVEPQTEAQVFDLFLKHFVEAGWVEPQYRRLLESARSRDFPALHRCSNDARALLTAVNALYQRMDDRFHFKSETEAAAQPIPTTDTAAELLEAVFNDLRGVACPMNFVKAKIVLDGMKAGQRLSILLDEGAPIQNVPRSIRSEGHKVLEQTKRGDHWFVLIEKC
jgi:sulfite reductase (ferredoxin)